MSKKVRRGMHARILWPILRAGIPEDFSNAESLTIHLSRANNNVKTFIPDTHMSIKDNVVSFIVTSEMQKALTSGEYKATISYRKVSATSPTLWEPYVLDKPCFTLVDSSEDLGGTTDGMEVLTIELDGEIGLPKEALPGASAYQIAVAHGFEGDEAEWLYSLKKPAIDAAAAAAIAANAANDAADAADAATSELNTVMQLLAQSESGRVQAEQGRVNAESSRQQAEESRNTKEGERNQAESGRDQAESGRVQAEQGRSNAEQTREQAEASRYNSETARKEAETYRSTAEQARNSAEQARAQAEQARTQAETARTESESARETAENARTEAEQARETAETAREQAEQGRGTTFEQKIQESEQATAAANTAAGAQNTYNVTVAVPLAAGSYYTKSTARAAVPAVSRKLGLVITYATADKVWYSEKYIGSTVSGWTTETNWEQVPDASKLTQFETDLNIKNAEQDASIKSIEQLLSQSNMNQTAQVSSSGREIISLPKTASNGGMDIKLEGLTAQNLVVNGDFRNGTTGWVTTTGTTIIDGGMQKTNPASSSYKDIVFPNGNKVYVVGKVKSLGTYPTMIRVFDYNSFLNPITVAQTTTAVYFKKGVIKTISNGGIRIDLAIIDTPGGAMDEVMAIDLTATFGAGNEPDLATCEAMFSTYFEGTKSFIPTGRVRSRIGINMFNPSDFVKNGVSNGLSPSFIRLSGNGILNKTISYVEKYFDYLKGCFEPNTQYTLKATGKITDYYDSQARVNIQFTYTDGSTQFVPLSPTESTISITSQSGKTVSHVGLRSWAYTGVVYIWDISLTKGSTQVPYEPYKSTKLYLTAPDLRSNGLVKDEVRKGSNGYEHVKRVGIGTLGEDKITNIDNREFTIDTGFWIKGTGWTISGGTLNRDGNATSSDCYRTTGITATIGKYYKITLYANVQLGQFKIAYGSAFSPFIKSTGKYVFYLKAILADGFYFTMSGGFSGSIENVSIKEVVTSDLILNETITEYGTDVHYTLEKPIITPIEHAGMLNSAESGTVFHEPVVADAGVYGTNLTVFYTTYPISSIEEIIVHTAVDTYLDVSKAVIASDGLSFTHPDLRAGDLVLFTYFFSKEKVNGLITATYYDGRYVIADTANGKFYKWGVKSTNGVATINLTEV